MMITATPSISHYYSSEGTWVPASIHRAGRVPGQLLQISPLQAQCTEPSPALHNQVQMPFTGKITDHTALAPGKLDLSSVDIIYFNCYLSQTKNLYSCVSPLSIQTTVFVEFFFFVWFCFLQHQGLNPGLSMGGSNALLLNDSPASLSIFHFLIVSSIGRGWT